MKVAALFVDAGGIYDGRPDVDAWPVERDARTYAGPWPVVAHPPCQRWGPLWAMGGRFGQDDGCFASALASVERCGGVLEHPAGSGAWPTFALPVPPRVGGWARRPGRPGWACYVEQGHYGHPARKPTLLYYVGPSEPPPLVWGRCSSAVAVVAGPVRRPGMRVCSPVERRATPPAFAALLVELAGAASCEPSRSSEATGRRCMWCAAPLPPGTRSHAVTCSKVCRQARQRWGAQGRTVATPARSVQGRLW